MYQNRRYGSLLIYCVYFVFVGVKKVRLSVKEAAKPQKSSLDLSWLSYYWLLGQALALEFT